MDERELIFDWNQVDDPPARNGTLEFDDETLRDGLQSPSITLPPVEERKELLHLMVQLGIHAANIGLPGAGGRFTNDAKELAREIARHHLPIAPNCAGRTVVADILPIVEASQASGLAVEAALFIGSSPIREYVEQWTIDNMAARVEQAVCFARREGLPVMFVTEDTSRAKPDHLRRLYQTAIACGARRICLADTVGHATPAGVRALVRFAQQVVHESGKDVKIDWHGHNDRGLSLINAMTAFEAGANRVHVTALGVGERCGNVPTEMLLTNLRLEGLIDNDLTKLGEYTDLVSRFWSVPIPHNHPIVGQDAFRTSTGVHASAVVKAARAGREWLADRVYSSIPAQWVGRTQSIEIGPMSGASNVTHWLDRHGIAHTPELVQCILAFAKASDQNLTSLQIQQLVAEHV